MRIAQVLKESPIIATINSEEDFEVCMESKCRIVLIIHSTLKNVGSLVKQVKESGRIAIVHADLVAGLSPKEVAVEFLLTQTGADGIVSTKPILIKKAKEMGKIGILRAFIIDSSAFETMKWQLKTLKPDAVELMPGIIPSIFSEMKSCTEIPVIATGLIRGRQDAITAFEAGVDGVSSSNHTIWFLEQV